MALSDLLPRLAELRRMTAMIITVAAWPFPPTSVSWSASYPARVRATGTNLSGDATVKIIGVGSGGAQEELLSVSANSPSIAFSTKRWLSITAVESATSIDGSVLLEGVEQSGAPLFVNTVIAANLAVRMRWRILRQDQIEQGLTQNELWTIYTMLDGVQDGDTFVIEGTEYNVENVIRMFGARLFHHSEVLARRLP